MNHKELWNEREYKFVRMDQRVVVPGRSASVTEQFDPTRKVSLLTNSEKSNAFITKLISQHVSDKELSLRRQVVTAKKMVLISAPDLRKGDWDRIDKWKSLQKYFDQKQIPCVLLTASSESVIRSFKETYHFEVPVFVNDATELKTISRSNISIDNNNAID